MRRSRSGPDWFDDVQAGAGALGASLADLLAATGLGIIQLDRRGRIAAANDRALALLRTGDGLVDQDGVLGADVPADDAVLQGLLTRALPPFGGQGAGGSMTVRRAADPQPLVVHLMPIGRPETAVCTWAGGRGGAAGRPGAPAAVRIRRWWRRALASPRWRAGWRCCWPRARACVRSPRRRGARPPRSGGTCGKSSPSTASPDRWSWCGWCCRWRVRRTSGGKTRGGGPRIPSGISRQTPPYGGHEDRARVCRIRSGFVGRNQRAVGRYDDGACVDAGTDESDSTTNGSTSVQVHGGGAGTGAGGDFANEKECGGDRVSIPPWWPGR